MNHFNGQRDDLDPASGDLPATRQTKLVELVNETGQVTVSELVSRFGVSRDTIRRDLTQLEARRLIVRTHGGAVSADRTVMTNTPLSSRMDARVSAKQRIGKAAAGLIRDGETLIVNGGSTTTYFVAELHERRDLTIVSNNLRVLSALPERCLWAVYLLGGTYLQSTQSVVGFNGFTSMPLINVNTAVIGVAGICAAGFSTGTIEEAHATRAIMETSRRTIVVADGSKCNVGAFAWIAELKNVEHFVTDVMPDDALRAALDAAEVEIMVCEPGSQKPF